MRRLLIPAAILALAGLGAAGFARAASTAPEPETRVPISLGVLSVAIGGEGRMLGSLRIEPFIAAPEAQQAIVAERLPAIREAVLIALHDEVRLAVEPGRPVDAAGLAALAAEAASTAAGAPVGVLIADLGTA